MPPSRSLSKARRPVERWMTVGSSHGSSGRGASDTPAWFHRYVAGAGRFEPRGRARAPASPQETVVDNIGGAARLMTAM